MWTANHDSSLILHYILPVFNEAPILNQTRASLNAKTLQLLNENIQINQIYVNNGSTDSSIETMKNFSAYDASFKIFSESFAGIGYAYHRGAAEALRSQKQNSKDSWIVLSAADLPFEFSDLQSFLNKLPTSITPLMIGSKAHKKSKIDTHFNRKLASWIYLVLRKIILGMKTKDPQGVLFLRTDLAKILLPHLRSRNFFYTTELVYHAEKMKVPVLELPVIYQGSSRKSTVKIFRHGLQMIFQTIQLRMRKKPSDYFQVPQESEGK